MNTFPSIMVNTRVLKNGVIKIPELKNRYNQDVQVVVVFKQNMTDENSNAFDFKAYKKRILKVSTWTEEEVKIFSENEKLFNEWKIESF